MTKIVGAATPAADVFGDVRDFKRCPKCGRAFESHVRHCVVDDAELITARGPTLLGRLLAQRYLVRQLLGSGGMGEVYNVWHVLLDKPLALKVVLPSLADRSTAVALLRREARNASRVEHSNVVRVYDLEFDAGLLFLTMDFVPGPTLLEVVAALGPLQPHLVAEVVSHIALGLEAIHGAGIVHRDLKPSNVILTRARDGRPLAKLLDFGISRAFDDPDQSITGSGLVVGTPVFMSPEQRAGIALDKRADVFALGVLAAFLLAGELPRIAPAMCLRLADVPASKAWPDAVRHALLHALMWERTQRAASSERFAMQLREAVAAFPRGDRASTMDDVLASGRWGLDETTLTRTPTPVGHKPEPTLHRTAELVLADSNRTGAGERHGSEPRGPRVVGVSGPLAGLTFEVGELPVVIGRDPSECRIAFPASASAVSRIHASILWNDAVGRFILRDEGSKNSTFLDNSERAEPGVAIELLPGATFSVADQEYRFCVMVD